MLSLRTHAIISAGILATIIVLAMVGNASAPEKSSARLLSELDIRVDQHRASFETAASRPPQDEEILV